VLWLVFVVAATLAGAAAGTQQLSAAEQEVGESAEAQRLSTRRVQHPRR
jgi:hypothetical protein